MRFFFHRFFALAFSLCAFISTGSQAAGNGGKPEEVVRAFYQMLDKGQVDQAVAMLSAGNMDASEKERALAGFKKNLSKSADRMAEQGGLKNLEIVSLKTGENNGSAVVEIKATFMQPDKWGLGKSVFSLKNENGAWKISNIK